MSCAGSHKQEESHLDSPNKYNASENVCGSSSRGDMKSQGGDSCVCSVEVELATSTTEAEASHAATRGMVFCSSMPDVCMPFGATFW